VQLGGASYLTGSQATCCAAVAALLRLKLCTLCTMQNGQNNTMKL
jgi:hypothetical protein